MIANEALERRQARDVDFGQMIPKLLAQRIVGGRIDFGAGRGQGGATGTGSGGFVTRGDRVR